MAVKIEIKNIEEFKAAMEKKQQEIKRTLPIGVQKATLYVHGKVKESIARGTNAPVAVDTGRFLQSTDFEALGDDARVYTDLEYAKFIEYGTSKMKARPHYRNTAAKEKHKVRDMIAEEMKSI